MQKYLSLTGHFYAPAILLINKAFWENTLTEDLRKIFTEAELKARHWEREFCIEIEKQLVGDLKAQGMEVTEPDKAKFFEAVQPVYKEFEEKVGKEAIQKLVDAQK